MSQLHDQFLNLMKNPKFRADLFGYFHLVGGYCNAIFTECKNRIRNNNHNKYHEYCDALQEDDNMRSDFLPTMRHIFPKFDAFDKNFTYFLHGLPENIKASFNNRLKNDHVLPFTCDQWQIILDQLREWRNFLQHFDEWHQKCKVPAISSEQMLYRIGLFLLPHFHNHLLGRIRHYNTATACLSEQNIAKIDDIFREAIAVRKQLTINRNSSRKKDFLTKKERKDKENSKTAWMAKYVHYYPKGHWTVYKLHRFQTRYYFMGKSTIYHLEQMLIAQDSRKTPDAICHFKNETEALYYLSLDIQLILSRFLHIYEAQGVKIRNKRKMGKTIPLLRNSIAHGGLFFQIDKNYGQDDSQRDIISVKEIFYEMLFLPKKSGLQHPKEAVNQIFTAIEGRINANNFVEIYPIAANDDPNQTPAPIKINHWHKNNREKYHNREKYRIDRRYRIRKICAQWLKDLRTARAEILRKI